MMVLLIPAFGQTVKHPERNRVKDSLEIERVKNKTEFIFEGYVQSIEEYPRDGNFYLISTIVKIKRVFRGNLKPGTTIEIITKPTNSGNSYYPAKRETLSTGGDSMLYFCRDAGKDYPYDAKYNIHQVDNRVILAPASYFVHAIRIPHYGWIGDLSFKNRIEFFKYLKTWPNMNQSAFTKEDTVFESMNYVSSSHTISYTKAQVDSMNNLKKKCN